MRFDERFTSLATYLTILLFNVYALGLYFGDRLTLYVHPRYVLFTVVLNAVSLILCGAGFVLAAWRTASGVGESGESSAPSGRASWRSWRSWRPPLALLATGLVLLAAYALPARTLSSGTADQRGDNFNVARVDPSGGSAGDTLALFGADTGRLAIADWVSAFALEADAGFYAGKEVDVVGFVYHPEGAPADVFYVSRFRVTCCAVDAQPLGLPVRSPGWQGRFETDSWVRVAGVFAKDPYGVAVGEPVVVDPQSVEPTGQPENPYVT